MSNSNKVTEGVIVHYKLPVSFGDAKSTEDLHICIHAVDRWVEYHSTKSRNKAENCIRKALHDSCPYTPNKDALDSSEVRHGKRPKYYKCRGYIFVLNNTRVVTLYPDRIKKKPPGYKRGKLVSA